MSSSRTSSQESWGIHWFRRDLRLTGNQALLYNLKKNQGRTLGLFCFDSLFLGRKDFSHNRFAFFLETLNELREDMRALGGELLVVDELPIKAFPKILQHGRPNLVSWSRDYEPFARERDSQVEQFLQTQGVEVLVARDHLLFEPSEVKKGPGADDFYQIYSPFAKKWFMQLSSPVAQERLRRQNQKRGSHKFTMTWGDLGPKSSFPYTDAFKKFHSQNQKHVTVPIPVAGAKQALVQLRRFKKHLEDYNEQRNFPAVEGTSKLSYFLKNGSLTSAQIILELGLENQSFLSPRSLGPNQFLKEIVWREFYYSILFHRPDVEHQSFLPQYRKLKWENNKSWFERWQEGTTGFPIVDAGMRELRETGWMHNRVRMIVASFLTKDLLIDWRRGENHFMRYLLDGDLAPNNGGWQWAASTGCDPQPYFRIFNPWLQSEKFDPDGEYIKKYVPELRDLPAKALHRADVDRSKNNYPSPIVDHAVQKEKALRLYKSQK